MNYQEMASQLYEKVKHHKKVTPFLIMKIAGLEFDPSLKICECIWLKLHKEARMLSKDVMPN